MPLIEGSLAGSAAGECPALERLRRKSYCFFTVREQVILFDTLFLRKEGQFLFFMTS
jgi:hypothetical protein